MLDGGWRIPLGHGQRWLKMEGINSLNPPRLEQHPSPPRLHPASPEASAGASQMLERGGNISRRDPSPDLQLQPSHCEYLKPTGARVPPRAGPGSGGDAWHRPGPHPSAAGDLAPVLRPSWPRLAVVPLRFYF